MFWRKKQGFVPDDLKALSGMTHEQLTFLEKEVEKAEQKGYDRRGEEIAFSQSTFANVAYVCVGLGLSFFLIVGGKVVTIIGVNLRLVIIRMLTYQRSMTHA